MLKKSLLGDVIFLTHGTSKESLMNILKTRTLHSRDILEKQDIEEYGLGGEGRWVYLSPIHKSVLRKPLPDEFYVDFFAHYTIPETDVFGINLVLCPTLLFDRKDWYAAKDWVYGKVDESDKLSRKNIKESGRTEILFPDEIKFEPYLVAIVTRDFELYKKLLEKLPEKYKSKLIWERHVGFILDELFPLFYTQHELRWMERKVRERK